MNAGANTVGNVAGALGVEGAATGAGSQAAMLAAQNAGFGAEGLSSLANSAGVAAGATPVVPSTSNLLSSGFNVAKADPMAFAKNNLRNIGMAAAPIMAGAMVPTTTKLGDPRDTGNIRQFAYNINPDTGKPDPLYGMRAMTPVKASEFGNKTLQGQRNLFYQQNPNPYELGVGSLNQPPQQQPTPMAGGGIVALADGGLSAGAQYAATHGVDVGANIGKWIEDNPFATAADINKAITSVGLTQADVNPYLTANKDISDAQRYALSHTNEINGLAGLNANIMGALKENPNMTQAQIDAEQAKYGVTDANIQAPLAHGYQVAATDLSKAENYLNTNPDVMAWINSAEGRDYIMQHPSFDASDIAYTHYERYGKDEGRKWEDATKLPPIRPDEPIGKLPSVPPVGPPVKSTCPAPDMRILLANGSLKAAGDLEVGDVVRTQHETTLAWGDHPVTHVSIVPDVPRLKIELGDIKFVCSLDHKFFKSANDWVTAKDIALGDMLSGHVVRSLTQADVGDVVRITVDDAHTYICEGLLSHNKTPLPPVVLPDPFTSVVPTGFYGNETNPGDITVNKDGTVTVTPNIPYRPDGGFSGMTEVKDAYTKGGGSLGYTAPVPKTAAEHNAMYNKLTDDSLDAYNYLMGKGKNLTQRKAETRDRPVMQRYDEAVLGRKITRPTKTTTTTTAKTVVGTPGQPQTYFDEAAYLAANPDVAAEIKTGKSTSGKPTQFKSAYDHYVMYGKAEGRPFTGDYQGYLTALALASAAGAGGGGGGNTTSATTGNTASTVSDSNTANSITGLAASADNSISVSDAVASPADAPASTDGSPDGGPSGDGTGGEARGGLMPHGRYRLANGGMPSYAMGGGLGSLGSYSDGGRLLKGPGDGVSDSIPATIGRKQQPARLADGEFVIPARIVSELGNGSTDAGAKKLYAMMDRVQRARGKTTGKNKVAANSRADKYLPA
jgi:hypothetical protein